VSDPRGVKKYERRVHFIKLIRVLPKIKRDHDDYAVAGVVQAGFFEEKIRGLLCELGVYADLHHQYLAYAEALDKSQRDLAFMVDLIREHQILRDRFERRALDPDVLDAIDQAVIYRTTNY